MFELLHWTTRGEDIATGEMREGSNLINGSFAIVPAFRPSVVDDRGGLMRIMRLKSTLPPRAGRAALVAVQISRILRVDDAQVTCQPELGLVMLARRVD
jgi:hypothetical protein